MEVAVLATYMTTREVADALGVSRERVYLWIKSGRLPIAARSEYAGFLISRKTVERLGPSLIDSFIVKSR